MTDEHDDEYEAEAPDEEHEPDEADAEEDDEHDEYEFEVTATREEAATALRRVATGVVGGTVRIGEDEDAVDVAVPEEMELEVEFEVEDDEQSLEVELEWPADAVASAEAEPDEASEDVPSHTTGEPPESADETSGDESTADEKPVDLGDDGPIAGVEESSTADEPPADEEPPAVTSGEPSPSGARFEIFRDRADEWRWRLVHRNGNVIATSGEGYTRKHNARKGLQSVVRNAPTADVVDEPESQE